MRRFNYLVLTSAVLFTSCGSGWLSFASDDSKSSSNTITLGVTAGGAQPDFNATDAEPYIAIEAVNGVEMYKVMQLDFNLALRPSSANANTVEVFEDGLGNLIGDKLTVIVDDAKLKIFGTEPLRMLGKYELEVEGLKAESGEILPDRIISEFTVRDGELTAFGQISFLNSAGIVGMQPDLGSVVVIEGRNAQNDYIIGVTEAPAGGVFGPVDVLQEAAFLDETTQGGMHISPAGEVRSAIWLQGYPAGPCGTGPGPNVELYISQSVELGPWEMQVPDGEPDPRRIDEGIPSFAPNSAAPTGVVSWEPKLEYLENGDTIVTWWAWADFEDGLFHRWEVWSAVRPFGQPWLPPVRISGDGGNSTNGGNAIGWPHMAKGPDGVVYALWPRGNNREDVFDSQDRGTATSYMIASYDPLFSSWSTPTEFQLPGQLLPRPTGIKVGANGRAVITARSHDKGPRALLVDLQQGTLSAPIPLDPFGGGTEIQEDRMRPDCRAWEDCSNFNRLRSFVSNRQFPFPALLPVVGGANRIVVSWFGGPAGASEHLLYIAEFDFDSGVWITNEEVPGTQVEAIFPSGCGFVGLRVFGGDLAVDPHGNVTVLWSSADFGAAVPYGRAHAMRRRVVDGVVMPFAPLNGGGGGLPETHPDFDQSIISQFARFAIVPTTGVAHSSGQLIFGWDELNPAAGFDVQQSVFRRLE